MLTYNANTHTAEISRGDDLPFLRFTIRNAAGSTYDVSANSFRFTVKASIDDLIGAAKFQKQNPAVNGIDLAAAATGIVDVHFAAADTQALAGAYVFDLEMTEGGKVITFEPGRFIVRKDITTPGSAGQPAAVLVGFASAGFYFDGYFFWKDVTTGLYGAARLNNGFLQVSDNQSGTLPFTPVFS